jgi:hypothetical protein
MRDNEYVIDITQSIFPISVPVRLRHRPDAPLQPTLADFLLASFEQFKYDVASRFEDQSDSLQEICCKIKSK